MNKKDFEQWSKKIVCEYTNKLLEITDLDFITTDDVCIVCSSEIPEGYQAILRTTLFKWKYYECIYFNDEEKMYLNVYSRIDNKNYKK